MHHNSPVLLLATNNSTFTQEQNEINLWRDCYSRLLAQLITSAPIGDTGSDTQRYAMSRRQVLTAAFVRDVKQPGRHGDGRGGFGLSLLVKPTANGPLSKTWAQRVRTDGRASNLGLRQYPVLTSSPVPSM